MRQSTIRQGEIDGRSVWRVLATILLASAFLALPPYASAQQCDPIETYKLLALDRMNFDEFGHSVAISSTTAIVGAPQFSDFTNGKGSAYLFDATTGRQIAKLLASDGAEGDHFGNSVAISGNTAIVGARHDQDNGYHSGSAYLFDITTGQQIAKLLPSDGWPNDNFGFSVGISGTTAIIGAPDDGDNGTYSGSAYLFDITTGKQLFKLLPDDGAERHFFGISVAISGTTAIVGADEDNDNGEDSGSAYLFDTPTGQQIAKLLPKDGAPHDQFGESVGISGATAIVGAFGDDDNGGLSGSAYLFDIATGAQIAKLLPSDGAAGDHFGISVAISGNTAIVGANYDNGGSAYLFYTPTRQQIAKLLPGDGAADDHFGKSVAINDTAAIVGAPQYKGGGSAHVFEPNCSLSLRAIGSCPGRMGFQATFVTPGGKVAFLYASSPGFFTIPAGNPCAGTMLGLNRTVRLGTVVSAAGNGVATVIANIPAQACDRIFVQVLDVSTCETSNIAGL